MPITRCSPIEFFLNNTNLTFLAFLYKIDIKGVQDEQKIKLPPLEFNSQHQPSVDYKSNALPTQPQTRVYTPLHLEHDFIRAWKSETGKE